ncbi:MAG: dihydrolipoamide acetyltransferase family protein [Nocardioides sp.]|uniref:dihydrolipoamide acetyltransferase family protein n=1 Tax=Nocardioides sp. TaxID=35761 RepID=UPI0039E381D8
MVSTAATGEFRLPDVGEGLTEAEIVTWHVKVGDTIKVNDVVCDIETAKSVVELPSPYAGTVAALLVAEGDTVAVGTPIIRIGAPAESVPRTAESVVGAGESVPGAGESVPGTGESAPLTLVGPGPKEMAVSRRPRRTDSYAPATDSPAPTTDSAVLGTDSARVLAKPPVRKLAKDLGVDLAALVPGRADGVITRAEVEAAAAEPVAPGARETRGTHETRETREPIKGVRRTMGQAMVDSAFTLPHVTVWTTVDVTVTTRLVERLRAHRDFRDVKVSPLLVVAKACLLALRRTPILNSVWDEAAQEIVFKHYVNLGIAAATPRGLVVPNIKDAGAMPLVDLGRAINALTATAREGRTLPADQAGGTFTITNVGPFGMDGGTPIINPGESAILCLGAIKRQPWVVDEGAGERIEPRDVCTLAVSFDHRHIDGEAGSAFLADVAAVVEDPANALLL